MSSKKMSLFANFHRSIYSAAAETSFSNSFDEFSRSGNSLAIIQMIMRLPAVGKLEITESYARKNNTKAKELLKEANMIKSHESAKTDLLTKALFAATVIEENNIFLEIQMQRMRSWYELASFLRCIKDCEYVIALPKYHSGSKDSATYFTECKIECFLQKSKCLKRLGEWERAKSCIREGMNEVNNLIKMNNEYVPISNEEKLKMVKPFLELLKDLKNVEKQNRMVEASGISIPYIDGKPNVQLKCCSDAISLKHNPTRGRHIVATRNIKTGSILIVDEPFSWSTDEEALERNCLHCHASLQLNENIAVPCHSCQTAHFCSEGCREKAWEKYHKYECTIFDLFYGIEGRQTSQLLLAYRTTIAIAIKNSADQDILNPKFIEYHAVPDDEKKKLKIGLDEKYDPLDYRTVYSLETNHKHVTSKLNLMLAIQSVFLVKCFGFMLGRVNPGIYLETEEDILAVGTLHHLQAINCNAYEIVENIRNEETKVWEPRNIGGALYATVSLVNHSCYPNVVRHSYPQGKVVVRALRFIKKGEEILDCYGPHFLSENKTDRRKLLLEKYQFLCKCEACTHNWQLPINEILYKCRKCFETIKMSSTCCPQCHSKIDGKKIKRVLKESTKRRVDAIDKMFDGYYDTALTLLLDHADFIQKILAEPNFEAIKTQQAIVQCLNSMSCTSK